jgi:hypothetical protein
MGPVDLLLHWISTQESVGAGRLDGACLELAERFELSLLRDQRPRSWRDRYCGPLHRLGHVEERNNRWGIVPLTLVWTNEHEGGGWGSFCGARSRRVRKSLRQALGPSFRSAKQTGGPEVWTVLGIRAVVEKALRAVSPPISLIDEPSERLHAALPRLEASLIDEASPYHPVTEHRRWQRLSRPSSRSKMFWCDVEEAETDLDGLYREVGSGRSRWFIVRGEDKIVLKTSERRLIGWWAELARDRSRQLVYDVVRAELRLPAAGLRTPVLVDRGLCLATGRVPVRDLAAVAWCYSRVKHVQAHQVARILGMSMEIRS